MNKVQFLAFHKRACDDMHDITKAKNSDYTGDTTDPFYNFRHVEELGICTVEQGFLTRMTDKLSRLKALTVDEVNAKVKDESVQDTLLDLANYCILFAAYLKENNNEDADAIDPESLSYRVSYPEGAVSPIQNTRVSRCPSDT